MDFNINNMKKIITLIIIICATTLIQAQGDLVFNKALILEIVLHLSQFLKVRCGKFRAQMEVV